LVVAVTVSNLFSFISEFKYQWNNKESFQFIFGTMHVWEDLRNHSHSNQFKDRENEFSIVKDAPKTSWISLELY